MDNHFWIHQSSFSELVGYALLSPCAFNIAIILYKLHHHHFNCLYNSYNNNTLWVCFDNHKISHKEIKKFLIDEINGTIKTILIENKPTTDDLIVSQNYDILMKSFDNYDFKCDILQELAELYQQ